MKKFLLLYQGPAILPDASHEGWTEWFHKLGDTLVDRGSPMAQPATFERANYMKAPDSFDYYLP